jgi:hypothetical protein
LERWSKKDYQRFSQPSSTIKVISSFFNKQSFFFESGSNKNMYFYFLRSGGGFQRGDEIPPLLAGGAP